MTDKAEQYREARFRKKMRRFERRQNVQIVLMAILTIAIGQLVKFT